MALRGLMPQADESWEAWCPRHLERRLLPWADLGCLDRCPGCHAEPIRFAQGKLREASLCPSRRSFAALSMTSEGSRRTLGCAEAWQAACSLPWPLSWRNCCACLSPNVCWCPSPL